MSEVRKDVSEMVGWHKQCVLFYILLYDYHISSCNAIELDLIGHGCLVLFKGQFFIDGLLTCTLISENEITNSALAACYGEDGVVIFPSDFHIQFIRNNNLHYTYNY